MDDNTQSSRKFGHSTRSTIRFVFCSNYWPVCLLTNRFRSTLGLSGSEIISGIFSAVVSDEFSLLFFVSVTLSSTLFFSWSAYKHWINKTGCNTNRFVLIILWEVLEWIIVYLFKNWLWLVTALSNLITCALRYTIYHLLQLNWNLTISYGGTPRDISSCDSARSINCFRSFDLCCDEKASRSRECLCVYEYFFLVPHLFELFTVSS